MRWPSRLPLSMVQAETVLLSQSPQVRLDHLSIDYHPRGFDFEGSGAEVEQVATCARPFAAPHARGCFEHPQREEPVLAQALQERSVADRPSRSCGPCGERAAGVRRRRRLPSRRQHQVECPQWYAALFDGLVQRPDRRRGVRNDHCRVLHFGLALRRSFCCLCDIGRVADGAVDGHGRPAGSG
jgi:hypothetical protein